ncbi:MAG: urease accessory UreF family protein [Gordonia sp. (in: high G+C Gram-positive bacteria)]|uniref:urease accessory protein UreF n=1 Tax=Gordonia sp. (in: high G+C Gram-positive bacteria) TaxID=84139 RepID=UPI0039E3F183
MSAYAAMLLADARLPTGGHAYSAGVEPALRAGLAPDRVREYMIGRALTTSRTEAGTAVVARSALAGGSSSGLSPGNGLDDVLAAWAARTPSPALREAAVAQGRGYLRFARSLWPGAPELEELTAVTRPLCRPVVLGAVAVLAAMSPADLVRLVIYDDAATAAAALLKLEPRDPAEVSGWVLDACAAAEPSVAELAALTDPGAIPASGAPQTEEWAQAHAVMNQRLFRA